MAILQMLVAAGTSAGPPISYIGAVSGTLNAASFSFTPASGSAVGDTVIAYISSSNNNASQNTRVNGWADQMVVGPGLFGSGGNGMYRRLQSFVLTSVSTQSISILSSDSSTSVLFMTFRNVRASTPVTDVQSGGYTNPGASSPSPLSPSKTGAIAGQMICYISNSSGGIILTPVGSSGAMTSAVAPANNNLRYRSVPAIGDYSWNATWAGGTGSAMQHQFVLNPS